MTIREMNQKLIQGNIINSKVLKVIEETNNCIDVSEIRRAILIITDSDVSIDRYIEYINETEGNVGYKKVAYDLIIEKSFNEIREINKNSRREGLVWCDDVESLFYGESYSGVSFFVQYHEIKQTYIDVNPLLVEYLAELKKANKLTKTTEYFYNQLKNGVKNEKKH